MKISIFSCFFLISFHNYGQPLDLNTCNGFTELSAHTNCLKNILNHLILKELEKDVDMLRLQQGVSEKLDVEIEVSSVGNFSISSIQTLNFAIARAVNVVISSMKPVEMYKDRDGNFIKSLLVIRNTYSITPENKIEVIDLLQKETNKNQEAVDSETIEAEKIPFAIVENVPVFPGCENGDNQAREKCMSVAIDQYVKENFNLSLVDSIHLDAGLYAIKTQFKVDKNGYIIDILATGPHPLLEEEAKRVLESLPKMKPGRQKGKEVTVLYSLPILFQVEDDSPQEKKKKSRKSKKF